MREWANVPTRTTGGNYDDVRALVNLLNADQAISPTELSLLFRALDYAATSSKYGKLRTITGTNPNAGVETNETVPAGVQWLLRSWRATLVTSSTAGARNVHLIVDDGITILWNSVANLTQAASLTRNYNAFHIDALVGASDSEIYINMQPDVLLGAGFRIRTLTTLFKVDDNWAAPQMLVEEFAAL